MDTPEHRPFGLVLPALLGAVGGLLNALLLWLQVPEKVVDFKPVILVCGALHGGVLAACGIAAANIALRRARLRLPIWIVAGYLAGWISWIPTHVLIADSPPSKALLWPFMLERPLEAVWRPFQYFGMVGLVLAVVLTIASPGMRRSPLGLRGLAIGSGVLGSLWFWGVFQAHMRMGYLALLHGTLWGLLVGAGLALARERKHP